ncbi:hypothetical protein ACQCN2_10030 [Brevibacillus ginsengisoli]|uniref:hypothetical protein n=1 Tax=Brevibacillus ginsengisoli TaxID=363854 RepID=UPI003CFAA37E
MRNLDLDVNILHCTTAICLDHSILAAFLPTYRITASEAIHEELLVKNVTEKLRDLEQQLSITEIELDKLELYISYLPKDLVLRSDAEYRLAQLREVNMLKIELATWSATSKPTTIDKHLIKQLHSIQARVRNCLNSPLKQQLLGTIHELTNTYDLSLTSIQLDQITVNKLETVEDVDNHLIGFMIAEYIDLDPETRLEIAQNIYEQPVLLQLSDDELVTEVIRLVKSYSASLTQLTSSENNNQSNTDCLLIKNATEGIHIVDGQIRLV